MHDMVTGSVGHEFPGFEEVKIYPNPSIEKINIEMQSGLTATALITDIRGKVVRILDLKDRITTVPISDLASGPYIIRISMKDKVFIKKIIVQ
jgi:hypothetical protein